MLKVSFNQIVRSIILSVIGTLVISTACANPAGETIVYGGIDIKHQPHKTIITQTTPKAIVEWKSFNIDKNEHVQIQQPPGGILLVRVNPGEGSSEIKGHFSATGRVIFVNQSGVNFTSTSHVAVGI